MIRPWTAERAVAREEAGAIGMANDSSSRRSLSCAYSCLRLARSGSLAAALNNWV